MDYQDLGTCIRYKPADVPRSYPIPAEGEELPVPTQPSPAYGLEFEDLGGPGADPAWKVIQELERGPYPMHAAHTAGALGVPETVGVGEPIEFKIAFPPLRDEDGHEYRDRIAVVLRVDFMGPELVLGDVVNNRDSTYTVSVPDGLRVPGTYELYVRVHHFAFPFSMPDRSDGSHARCNYDPNEPDYTVQWYDCVLIGFPKVVEVTGTIHELVTIEGRAAKLPRCMFMEDASHGRWINTHHKALSAWSSPGSPWFRFLDRVARDRWVWLPSTCRLLPIYDHAAMACVMGQNMTVRATGDSHVRQTINLFSHQVLAVGTARSLGHDETDMDGFVFRPGMERHRDFDFWQYYTAESGRVANAPHKTADGVTAKYGRLVGRMTWRPAPSPETSSLLRNLMELVDNTARPDGWDTDVDPKVKSDLLEPGSLFLADFGAWYIAQVSDNVVQHARDFAKFFTESFIDTDTPIKGKVGFIAVPPYNQFIDPKRNLHPTCDNNLRRLALTRAVRPILLNAGVDVLDLFTLSYPRYYLDHTRCSGHWVCEPLDLAPIGLWQQIIILNAICPGTWSDCA